MSHLFMNSLHAAMFTPRGARIAARLDMSKIDLLKAHASIGDCGQGSLDYEIIDGVAVIDIHGALTSASIPMWFFYGDITYEAVIEAVESAVLDSSVHAILLRFNSPGGTVTGCAQAASALSRLSESKNIVAHCKMADSAAYWLASAVNEIHVDPTGEVGSIGVICMHWDYSAQLEEMGIVVTPLTAGKHKSDANPYQPLTAQAKKRLEAEMEYLRGQFVSGVAVNRLLDIEDVRETEALTYIGQLGVDAGLADHVGFADELLEHLIELHP